MNNTQSGFIGVRIGDKAKDRLSREAVARGISLSAHVKQILGGDVPKEEDQISAPLPENGWRELVVSLGDLEKQRVGLEAAIEERSGFFTEAPYALRLSLQACKHAMTVLQEELEDTLPAEAVEAVKGKKLDKWGDPIKDKWSQ